MSNIVNLPPRPSHLGPSVARTSPLMENVGTGFAVLSFRGKVWRVRSGDDERVLMREGSREPLQNIQVVIVAASPALSKTYYPGRYTPGDDTPPTCWSNDGLRPDRRVPPEQRQAATCAICPHNQWGSRVSEQGATKLKACSDNRRLAVVPAHDPENAAYGGPMLLRVPAASLVPLAKYGNELVAAGYAEWEVITNISFDLSAEHPKLTFTAAGVIDERTYGIVSRFRAAPAVQAILGREEEPIETSGQWQAAQPALKAAEPPMIAHTAEPDSEPEPESEPEPKPEPKSTMRGRPTKVAPVPTPTADGGPDQSDLNLDDMINQALNLVKRGAN